MQAILLKLPSDWDGFYPLNLIPTPYSAYFLGGGCPRLPRSLLFNK
jgi:hypothetical protein